MFRAGEGACLHLACVEATYELVGATTGLVVGQRATVTGWVDRTVLSQCGRGIPFVVTHGSPLPTGGD